MHLNVIKGSVQQVQYDAHTIRFEDLKAWVKRGVFFRRLGRYRTTTLWVYSLDTLARPFLLAILLRWLTHGTVIFQDDLGRQQRIGWRYLVGMARRYITEWWRRRSVVSAFEQHIATLLNQSSVPCTLDLTHRPLYLRTDNDYGKKSGGHVGHIAGVLNTLPDPIFVTTDAIPTVAERIETHYLSVPKQFWDFPELISMATNTLFLQETQTFIANRPISFIYQRYSLHNITGLQLAAYLQTPFVLEYNGSEAWIRRHWNEAPLKYETIALQVEQANFQAATAIIVVSEPLKDELVALGIDAHKILVNPNGIDPTRYSPEIDGSTIRRQWDIENQIVLGFIGSFGAWHGVEVLAEAFGVFLSRYPSYRPQVTLLLIGDGQKMPEVRANLAHHQATDKAILTGLVPQAEGPSYLAACDILISPHIPTPDGRRFFGSPTKLFEYMAMGKGIIASDLDQIGAVLKHDHTAWMVPPHDIDALVEAIKLLVDNPELRQRLGASARQEVVAHYTWERHTQRIIDHLQDCCHA